MLCHHQNKPMGALLWCKQKSPQHLLIPASYVDILLCGLLVVSRQTRYLLVSTDVALDWPWCTESPVKSTDDSEMLPLCTSCPVLIFSNPASNIGYHKIGCHACSHTTNETSGSSGCKTRALSWWLLSHLSCLIMCFITCHIFSVGHTSGPLSGLFRTHMLALRVHAVVRQVKCSSIVLLE